MTLTDRLKTRARELGFDLIGLTAPDPLPHADFFAEWIAAGYHGEMRYLATERALERRGDPRLILPECKSVIVVGVNYGAEPVQSESGDERVQGRVARYAHGADYHDWLPRRMAELVAFLEAEVGHPIAHKIYADTGPLLERDLAQRAGLGWIGKNTLLINPQIGS